MMLNSVSFVDFTGKITPVDFRSDQPKSLYCRDSSGSMAVCNPVNDLKRLICGNDPAGLTHYLQMEFIFTEVPLVSLMPVEELVVAVEKEFGPFRLIQHLRMLVTPSLKGIRTQPRVGKIEYEADHSPLFRTVVTPMSQSIYQQSLTYDIFAHALLPSI